MVLRRVGEFSPVMLIYSAEKKSFESVGGRVVEIQVLCERNGRVLITGTGQTSASISSKSSDHEFAAGRVRLQDVVLSR